MPNRLDRCTDCSGYFTVKTNTIMLNPSFRFASGFFAIYLEMTSLKAYSA